MEPHPFLPETVAKRYARGRPYFHPSVIRMIRDYLTLRHPLRVALDVGCGTGQSATALEEIAETVIGVDVSMHMLNESLRSTRIQYVNAPAEKLPFSDTSFDLITASLAFHWFARDEFLAEAARLIGAHGWLVIYNRWFSGQMEEASDFSDWYSDVYQERHPSLLGSTTLTDENVKVHGLELVEQIAYVEDEHFSFRQLVDYLMTQSNIALAVELGAQSVESVHEWLVRSLNPWSTISRCTCRFDGYIWYIRSHRP